MDVSSFGISMVDSFTLILKQQQIDELYALSKHNNAKPNFHIYFIVRRPRIFFDATSLKLDEKFLKGSFKIQDKDTYKTVEFKEEHNFKHENLTIKCEYPHDKMYIIDLKDNNKEIFGGYASLMIQQFNTAYYIDDSEVLYVGQAFGKNGSRTAETRLLSHATLQKIYSENTPDKEIWITLWDFDRNELMFLSPNVDEKDNYQLFKKYLDYIHTRHEKISFEQEINFTEAALIRYFQPIYNDDYKYTFPSKSHSTYSQCYKLELDYVSIEINTKRLNMRLWSEKKPVKKFDHKIIYPLKNKTEIKDFFGIK